MHALALVLVFLLARVTLTDLPAPPSASSVTPRPRFVVLDDYIRDALAAEWERHAKDSPILERIYCVKYQRDYWAGEPAYRVTQIMAGDSAWGAPTHSYIVCPKGFGNAVIHTHPPTTCDPGGCYPNGPYSYQCLPSDDDIGFVRWRGDEFGLVQCDTRAVVTYWP